MLIPSPPRAGSRSPSTGQEKIRRSPSGNTRMITASKTVRSPGRSKLETTSFGSTIPRWDKLPTEVRLYGVCPRGFLENRSRCKLTPRALSSLPSTPVDPSGVLEDDNAIVNLSSSRAGTSVPFQDQTMRPHPFLPKIIDIKPGVGHYSPMQEAYHPEFAG
jgi:hypothetical protein